MHRKADEGDTGRVDRENAAGECMGGAKVKRLPSRPRLCVQAKARLARPDSNLLILRHAQMLAAHHSVRCLMI